MRNFSLNHTDDTALQFADYFGEKYKPYLYVLYKKLQEGQICVSKSRIPSEIPEDYLSQFPGVTEAFTFEETGDLIAECEGNLYLQRYFRYETQIIEKLTQLISVNDPIPTQKDLPSLHDSDGTINWQSVAVLVSMMHTFTIITGGPGTGKTTTVSRILNHLLKANAELRIALAAPTGKAAARMGESLKNSASQLPNEIRAVFDNLEPLTIHRLLGTIKGSASFRHNEENPLPCDILIIDECSMIDMALFSKLLAAVGKETRLILLGDRNQLASVEAGSLFGDLCEIAGKSNQFSSQMIREIETVTGIKSEIPVHGHPAPMSDHVIELQKSYRFSGEKGIGRLSHEVISENESGVRDLIGESDDEIKIDTSYDPGVFESFVTHFEAYLNEPDIATALKKLNQCKVLCATHEGRYGLYQTNLRIEKLLERRKLIQRQKTFYENRPVMITRNNYTLQLYNGDIGIVRKDNNGKLRVWFEINNQLVNFAPALISGEETAFAITIHKSQGSEFDRVLILLPEKDLPLLTKELVYTAITRAKKHAILQASETSLLSAIHKKVERSSGIKNRFK